MSNPRGSWDYSSLSYRSQPMSVEEPSLSSNSPSRQFRADASTFRPSIGSSRTLTQDAFEASPTSPVYALQTSTFLPPDTPSLSSSTPPPTAHEAQVSTPTAKSTYYHHRGSTKESPMKASNLFFGLSGIWEAAPNELNYAHNRGRSEALHNDPDVAYNPPRPRSRSDAPTVGFGQGGLPQTAPTSSSQSKRGSIDSSPNFVHELAAPSPRRQPPLIQTAIAQDLGGRDTPGGVSLPKDIISPSSSSQSPSKAANAKALADFIRSGGAEPSPHGVHGPTLPLTRREAVPFPIPRQQQEAWQGSGTALQANTNPDPLVRQWKAKGGPTLTDLMQNVAFVERVRAVRPTNYGVMKLTDIPYTTTKPEVVALIGEKAPMVQMPLGSGTYAIHIIMERGTAKSMDAYVEFDNPDAAQQVVSRIEAHGRPMIQARRVTIRLSSQEALMKDLFPRTKCVRWEGSQPVIEQKKDTWSAGFRGFVSSEELVMTVKVAQNPQRSRFAIKHQQRTYESMISLMFKYPWNVVNSYTLAERDLIYKAVRDQLITLADKLRRDGPHPPVDFALLQELLDAGLKCPGFSESQRAKLIDATDGLAYPRAYVTPIAPHWPFEVLGRKDGFTDEFILYYISILRNGSAPALTSLAQMSAMGSGAFQTLNQHFGNFQIPWPAKKSDMTMAEAAKLEWDTVEHALRLAAKD